MAVFSRMLGVSFSVVVGLTGGFAFAETPFYPENQAIAQSFLAFEEGYQMGYRLGFNQGQEAQYNQAQYNPQILGVGSGFEYEYENEDDRRAQMGYQAGFLAGFHDGYYPAMDVNQPEIQRFNTGYNAGFSEGSQAAIACQQNPDCGYQPQSISQNPKDKPYDSGYRVGYLQGFDREWGN